MLKTLGLAKRFGGITALDGLDLEVASGTVHAVVGPNGSGKTTLFNLISGALLPTQGEIFFEGIRIGRMPAHARARLGIARTFQNIRLFADLTVLDNVLLGQHSRAPRGAASLFARSGARERTLRTEAMDLLESLRLQDLATRLAGELAYGPKRLVEIARAMAGRPRLLLLDEPTSGMNPRESEEVVHVIRHLASASMTIMIIEHHLPVVKDLAKIVTVLNFGRKIAEEAPAAVFGDPAVVEAYLGSEAAA